MATDDDLIDSVGPTEHAVGAAGSMASLLEELAATGPAGALAPGTLVGGQYRIERAVGAGGMGVVYLARDQRLDRAVAIKLGAARSAAMLGRLQREAGALARLAHPNVVVVHQFGEHDGRVFIAMEYVAGGTARTWVEARPRGWRAVVALYTAAGDGLAAAHAAGLIHRDFKPDNVLVGDDGRPRVADFGLVRATLASTHETPDATTDDGAMTATRAGTVLGTPAYMPPEQLAGTVADARADQFSFSASLWEALLGARPFTGATPAEMRAAIESSPPAIAESGERRRVPRHVLDALRRGLRPARDQRWPSMTPLLAALRRDPTARRRRVALVLTSAAVAAAIAIPLALRAGHAADPCTDGPAALAPTWNADRSARVAAAIGPVAAPAIEQRIAGYADAWALGHRDACRATRVARSQSEDLLDRRMHCLARARTELDATLAVLERGGPAASAAAADAIGALPELAACADTEALAEEVALPSDPTARARVEAADRLLADARVAELDRAQADPIGKAALALTAARAGGWRPQLARALATHGTVLDDAGRREEARATYQEAARVALAGHSDGTAARALADLAWNLDGDARPAEARLALDLAQSLADRGTSAYVQRRVLGATAVIAMHGGRADDAIAIRRQLIAMTERDPGAPREWAASDQFNLAGALETAGKSAEAEAVAATAVALAERNLGPTHPTVGKYLVQLAASRINQGKLAEAAAAAERALTLLEAWYGADDVRLYEALESVGVIRQRQGNAAAAQAMWRRQLAIAIAHRPADAPAIQSRLAVFLLEAGDLTGAAAAVAAAIATIEHAQGPNASDLMDPLLLIAYIAREQGHLADSRRDFQRALAIGEAALGSGHPSVHNLRIELAKTLLASRQPAAAEAILAPVLAATAARSDLDLMIVVESHLVLAGVRRAQHDRAAARVLAAAAMARAAAAPDRADVAATVAAWRAANPHR